MKISLVVWAYVCVLTDAFAMILGHQYGPAAPHDVNVILAE
jgi:hypothetical protein